MEYELGVDLGTTQTAAAVYEDGRVDVVPLGSRRKEIPSLVFLHADGQVLVGEAAERRGAVEPGRLAREFKRRVGDPVPVLLGGSPYSAHALMARLLGEVVAIVTRQQDAPPTTVTVTHPANWGPYKRDLLAQAARLAEVDRVTLCPEPEAAAVQYAAGVRVRPGDVVAVYDLGGGTFDAAVLRKTETGFTILGESEGIEQLGGIDFDEAVFGYVVETLGAAAGDLDPDDDDVTAALARLRRDCVTAKEALSFDTETMIPVALPGLHTRVRLNRSEFEAMIRPSLGDTVAATHRALRSAGVTPAELTSVLLAGGSSRIPLVGQLLGADFDVRVVLDPRPEHTIALGAARAGALTAAPTTAPALSTVVEQVSVGAGTPTRSRPVPIPAGGPAGPAVHDLPRDDPTTVDLMTTGARRPRPGSPGTPVLAALAVLLVMVGLGGAWWLNRPDRADEPAAGPGGWTTVRLPDSPAAFEAAAVTAFQGRLWVAGGVAPTEGRPYLTAVQIFDPLSGRWTEGPRLPKAVAFAALVSTGTVLYLIGGMHADGSTSDVLRLTAGTPGRWERGPRLPQPRGAGAAVYDGTGRILFAGGVRPDHSTADEIWALEKDRWTAAGRLQRPREKLSATSDQLGTVWFMGGLQDRVKRTPLPTVDRGNRAGFTPDADLPAAVESGAGVYLHTVGPCVLGGRLETVFATSATCSVTPKGATLPRLAIARAGLGVGVLAGVVYAVGGYGTGIDGSGTFESLAPRDVPSPSASR